MSIVAADTGTTVHAGLAHRCASGAGNREAVLAVSYSRCEVASGGVGTSAEAASRRADLADPAIRFVMPRSN